MKLDLRRLARRRLAPRWTVVIAAVAALGAGGASALADDEVDAVLRKLNDTPSVVGSDEIKSYALVFAAYLELDPPPIEISTEFNNTTIWPGMSQWDRVSAWAESNAGMAEALLQSKDKTMLGLPYGTANVDDRFREADLVAAIGVDGSLRNNQFRYLDAIETIATFATAESYRRLEAGRIDDGFELAVASIFLMRQCCDREFVDEQLFAISLLIESLENLRDMMLTYREQTSAELFRDIAMQSLPFLRPDRSRLLLPEGDRVVSEALIQEVFDAGGQADREKFASTFGAVQSEDQPLTRFGAARRWRMVAEVHDSEEASLERLALVYDDWWRRWRVEAYDPILDISTQFDRTNPVRYAAVIYSTKNIEKVFGVRNELIAHVNGTAMAAGLCGYYRQFGNYPSSPDKMYAQMIRKRSDRDPFDTEFLPFKYRLLDERFAVDTPHGRIFLASGQALLYSKGQDNADGRGSDHTDDGAAGDIVLWPPIRTLLRQEGMLE